MDITFDRKTVWPVTDRGVVSKVEHQNMLLRWVWSILVGLGVFLASNVMFVVIWGVAMFVIFFLYLPKFANVGTLLSLIVWVPVESLIVLNAARSARKAAGGENLPFFVVLITTTTIATIYALWTWLIGPLSSHSYWWEF